ncbi:MAG: HAD family hydrolase [Magnetococcales bacterium]|nr:HAD family hydrolase [Magnetococcales bacterium]
MALALFDLDNTLLDGDSDYLWGKFLTTKGLVDTETYEAANRAFYEDYRRGQLDIQAYLSFQLEFLTRQEPAILNTLHQEFMAEFIKPIILPAGIQRIRHHKEQGDQVVIITATNRFVTGPIAQALEVPHLLATELAMENGRYTGFSQGTPCFREGKVIRLQEWIITHQETLSGSWFYSDSHNDLPLLSMVDHPVAVDPDDILADHARNHGWPIISLRHRNTVP